jgi:hypothetical protein
VSERHAIEVTWREAGLGYLGVVVPLEHVDAVTLRRRVFGSILEGDWFEANGIPHLVRD